MQWHFTGRRQTPQLFLSEACEPVTCGGEALVDARVDDLTAPAFGPHQPGATEHPKMLAHSRAGNLGSRSEHMHRGRAARQALQQQPALLIGQRSEQLRVWIGYVRNSAHILTLYHKMLQCQHASLHQSDSYRSTPTPKMEYVTSQPSLFSGFRP